MVLNVASSKSTSNYLLVASEPTGDKSLGVEVWKAEYFLKEKEMLELMNDSDTLLFCITEQFSLPIITVRLK